MAKVPECYSVTQEADQYSPQFPGDKEIALFAFRKETARPTKLREQTS